MKRTLDNEQNISSYNGKDRLSEDMLMAYLEGTLSPQQQRDVELMLADEGMESDAVDGLSQLEPQKASRTVRKINRKLHKTIAVKGKRGNTTIKADYVSLLATIVILMIVISAFIIVKLLLRK